MAGTIPSNVRNIPETIKLEENTQKKPPDVSLDNDFFDSTTKAQATKAKISQWDHMKLKSFCTAEETSNKMKATCPTRGTACQPYVRYGVCVWNTERTQFNSGKQSD